MLRVLWQLFLKLKYICHSSMIMQVVESQLRRKEFLKVKEIKYKDHPQLKRKDKKRINSNTVQMSSCQELAHNHLYKTQEEGLYQDCRDKV